MRNLQDIMTTQVLSVRTDATLVEVAKLMRDHDVGDVLVCNLDGSLHGIVTDRDVVVRAVALDRRPHETHAGDVCSTNPLRLAPTASIDEAVKVMRKHAVRRVPVVRDGKPVGIVSIGDLAREQDPRSALAQISTAFPNS